MKEFIAAGIQIAIQPGQVQANLQKATAWVERAVRENGAELAVLPETVTTGFTPNVPVDQLWAEQAITLDGPEVAQMAKAARQLGVHVVFPFYEKGARPGVVYNSSVLIDCEGQMLGLYRKTHLFPTERKAAGGWSTPGREASVVETRLAKIGMIICYDGDFPELSRVCAVNGAEVITRPSALMRSFEIWEMTNLARAYDNHVYMIAVNSIGPDGGNNYYFGSSMIVSPIAQKLAQGRGTEEIIYSKLDPQPIKRITYGASSPMIFDHLQDRNLSVYGDVLKPAQSRFEPARRIPYVEGAD